LAASYNSQRQLTIHHNAEKVLTWIWTKTATVLQKARLKEARTSSAAASIAAIAASMKPRRWALPKLLDASGKGEGGGGVRRRGFSPDLPAGPDLTRAVKETKEFRAVSREKFVCASANVGWGRGG
jgi:hypothetical protein